MSLKNNSVLSKNNTLQRLSFIPKTKLTPDYQMNWGHSFPKAPYPQRERKIVKTFDLKAFVNKKREENQSPFSEIFEKGDYFLFICCTLQSFLIECICQKLDSFNM